MERSPSTAILKGCSPCCYSRSGRSPGSCTCSSARSATWRPHRLPQPRVAARRSGRTSRLGTHRQRYPGGDHNHRALINRATDSGRGGSMLVRSSRRRCRWSASTSGRSPSASTSTCSPSIRSCSTASSTAATRPAASSSRRWPDRSPPSPAPGRDPGADAGEPAVADRAQARVAGHPPRPVPGRARQPDVGDRRRARRRGHPGGRRRLGRGLLADGERADQPGTRPLQRARRPTGDGLARTGRSSERSRRPTTS